MVKRLRLHAESREILGKEVKQLRQQGILPANVYGHNIPSLALQLETKVLQKTMFEAGGSQLIDLAIKGEKKARSVLIRDVQKGLRDELLHVDFYQVSMTEAITVPVAITLVGEAPDLKTNNLVLDQSVWEFQVKCLPNEIPQNIEVDISALTGAGHSISIKDVKTIKGVTILNNPEEVIARVRAQTVRAEEVKPAVEEAKVEAEPAAEGKEEAKK